MSLYNLPYYFKRFCFISGILLVLSLLTINRAFAAPRFLPGQTLNPGCLPSDADCAVVPSSSSGINSSITDLTSLVGATSSALYVTNIATLQNILAGNATATNLSVIGSLGANIISGNGNLITNLNGLNITSASTERDSFGRYNLKNWQAAVSRLEQGASTTATIAFIGDSFVLSGFIAPSLQNQLQGAFGDAGDGYIYYFGNLPQILHTVRNTTGTWSDERDASGDYGASLSMTTSFDISTPASKSLTGIFDSATIHYKLTTGGGTFCWQIDGGSCTNVDTGNSTDDVGFVTITGLTRNANHTLTVRVVSAGTAGVTLFGADLKKSQNGIRLHALGAGGSRTYDWQNTNQDLWAKGLAQLSPDVVIIMLGANDTYSASQHQTYLTNLINTIHSVLPLADIVLAPTPGGDSRYTYSNSQQDLARVNGYGFVDTISSIGENGVSRGLYQNDNLHPNAVGGQLIANHIYDFLNIVTPAAVIINGVSGYAGIGTSSPVAKLSVVGNSFIDGNLTVTGNSTFSDSLSVGGNLTGSSLTVTNALATSTLAGGFTLDTSGFVYQKSTGRVGIGTANPTNTLTVLADSNNLGISLYNPWTTGKQVANMYSSSGSGVLDLFRSDGLTIGSRISGEKTINSFVNSGGGNFGIGTSIPLAKLDISQISGGSTTLLSIASSTNGLGTSTVFAVTANGNVGIGTSTPVDKLQIKNTNTSIAFGETSPGVALIYEPGNNSMYMRAYALRFQSNGNNTRLSIEDNGNIYFNSNQLSLTQSSGYLGVGTSSPAYKFQVYIDSTHEGHVDNTGAWAQTSDKRLKKNIFTLNDALTKVMQLRGVRYDWAADQEATSSANIGFLAQEIEQVFPQFVSEGTNGIKGVAYGAFAPVLVQAIKEQQGLILSYAGATTSDQIVATTTESFASILSEPFVSAWDYLVGKIVMGVKIARELVAEKVTALVGNFEKVNSRDAYIQNGITTKDQGTGEYYCMYMKFGVMTSAKGKCEDVNPNVNQNQASTGTGSGGESSAIGSAISSMTPTADTATTTPTIDTTIPAVNVEPATSTVPSVESSASVSAESTTPPTDSTITPSSDASTASVEPVSSTMASTTN